MPWSVNGEIEFGPIALTLTIALLAATIVVEPLAGRRSFARLRAAADHDPGALIRYSRESLVASAVLLVADIAVLATAVSLPTAAVGLALVEPEAVVRGVRSLVTVTAEGPQDVSWLGYAVLFVMLLVTVLGLVVFLSARVAVVRTQRRDGLPYHLSPEAAKLPEASRRLLRIVMPVTAAQRRWVAAAAAADEAETVLRFYGIFLALLIGVVGMGPVGSWAVVTTLSLLRSLVTVGQWRPACEYAFMHAVAAALYLFFLPGSLLVPLLVTAHNSVIKALTPVTGQRERGVMEVLPDTEEPR
ncbi:hypothetical protein NI17_023045 [Thermobifida halotolerans]|uniref:Uncharacterized protein n=1 Tax=Thermobifida halotolerans TaxID=483545 RepID=A0A399FZW8_9ACTN|nr:hypothetical protein [Thermobifida halotolerans]UOE19551.1 hypothetical protein NI17_023045 [Thermobifida halotolerans]